jgi:hypothetical protein
MNTVLNYELFPRAGPRSNPGTVLEGISKYENRTSKVLHVPVLWIYYYPNSEDLRSKLSTQVRYGCTSTCILYQNTKFSCLRSFAVLNSELLQSINLAISGSRVWMRWGAAPLGNVVYRYFEVLH